MSIKTTHSVTREFSIEVLKRDLQKADDDQLAEMLEAIIHNGFYNFCIVTEAQLEEDKRQGFPVLDDLNNIPEYNNAW